MPHFVIECSDNVLEMQSADSIMNTVYDAAESTKLFAENDIKVRVQSYGHYKIGKGKHSFLHVFGYIMEGRSTEQKAALSRVITGELAKLFTDISFLSINIYDFEKATYCNKPLLDPLNTEGNRHF